MAKIMISYRREDSMDITGRIFDRLARHYDRETVFRDIDSIPPGIDFREHVRASIENSGVMLVVVGPRWIGDQHGQSRIQAETDYVRIEVETALNRPIPVIPLLVGGAAMPEPSQLPENIRALVYKNAVRVDSGRDFDHHMNGLIGATDKILGKAQTNVPASSTLSDLVNNDAKTMHQTAPVATAPRSNLFFPLVGGVMTMIGAMHIGWFLANLISAFSNGNIAQMFQVVWTFADMSFGFGGLIIGIGTLFRKHWTRGFGIVLCLLAASSNLLWFSEYFDKALPRSVLFGTALTTLLAMLGACLLLFWWPSPVEKQ